MRSWLHVLIEQSKTSIRIQIHVCIRRPLVGQKGVWCCCLSHSLDPPPGTAEGQKSRTQTPPPPGSRGQARPALPQLAVYGRSDSVSILMPSSLILGRLTSNLRRLGCILASSSPPWGAKYAIRIKVFAHFSNFATFP